MKLNYKALNIATAEKEENRKFFDVFNNMSSGSIGVADLLFLYRAGGASDKDFEEDFGKGIPELMQSILEGINDAGFLGKIDTSTIKEQFSSDSSETSGKSNKA